MGRVYKNYTKELKEQACRMVLETKMPVKMVAERFNVSLQLLYRWIDQYETYGKEKVSIVCRILTASRSSYYRKEKAGKEEEIALEKAIAHPTIRLVPTSMIAHT